MPDLASILSSMSKDAPNPDPIDILISERITELRDSPPYNGKAAQLAIAVGVDRRTIDRWCQHPAKRDGRVVPTTPSLREAQKIHRATGVSLDWLVGLASAREDRVAASTSYAQYRLEDITGLLTSVREKLAAIDQSGAAGVPAPSPGDILEGRPSARATRRPRRRGNGPRE